jgi:molybdenum cofactor cytidylyltransferase
LYPAPAREKRRLVRVEQMAVYNAAMITAVVLAAGASSRMGTQKLLLPLGGEALVRRTVRRVSEAGFDEVLVVVGYQREQVAASLEGLNVRQAVNLAYETGMGSSFRAAVIAMPDSAAAMFALADQPLLAPADYRRLLDAYRAGRADIVSVRYGEVTAPPHLFDRRYFPELAALQHGARPVLQRHRDEALVLPFSPELLLDVDTPEDYERARSVVDER